MADRCRVCSANDRAALIEYLAEQLWESRRHGTLDDWPWPEAGGYWQRIYRQEAETFIAAALR